MADGRRGSDRREPRALDPYDFVFVREPFFSYVSLNMSDSPKKSIFDLGRQRFARNIRWQFVANGSQAVIGGAYLIVLGRFLGAAEFGVFSAVTALVSVAGLLFEMRLQEVVARDFCHLDDEVPASSPDAPHLIDLFVLEALSRLLPSLGLVASASMAASLIRIPAEQANLIVLAAVGFLVSKVGTGVSTGLLRVLGRTDLIAGCMAADWGLRLVVTAIPAVAAHLSVTMALWIALLTGGAINALQVRLAYREFTVRVAPIRSEGWTPAAAWRRLRHARRLILSNLGVSGTDLMAKDLDVALISGLLPSEKVGLYKMAKSFVQVAWRAIDPFYIAIMPEIQKLWQRSKIDELNSLLKKTSLRLFALSSFLVITANTVVALLGARLLGPQYIDISSLMPLMSVWLMVCAPMIWGLPLAVAINRPELSVGGSLLGLLVGLVSFSMLTPQHGLSGAAIAWNATLISGFAFTITTSIWIARRTPAFQKE